MPVSVPTLKEQFGAPPVVVWEHFYFQSVDAEAYDKAAAIARRISQISRGKKTLILSENADTIGKVGEFVIRDYFASHADAAALPWVSFAETVNDPGRRDGKGCGDECDLKVGEIKVDVKTRQLHVDLTIAPNFDLRVPETEIRKPMDVFILAGYCPSTRYGYGFGWCTWDELQARPIRTDIRFPAKCVPLLDLHPLQTLPAYLAR
jgi:hypothetical protein